MTKSGPTKEMVQRAKKKARSMRNKYEWAKKMAERHVAEVEPKRLAMLEAQQALAAIMEAVEQSGG